MKTTTDNPKTEQIKFIDAMGIKDGQTINFKYLPVGVNTKVIHMTGTVKGQWLGYPRVLGVKGYPLYIVYASDFISVQA